MLYRMHLKKHCLCHQTSVVESPVRPAPVPRPHPLRLPVHLKILQLPPLSQLLLLPAVKAAALQPWIQSVMHIKTVSTSFSSSSFPRFCTFFISVHSFTKNYIMQYKYKQHIFLFFISFFKL